MPPAVRVMLGRKGALARQRRYGSKRGNKGSRNVGASGLRWLTACLLFLLTASFGWKADAVVRAADQKPDFVRLYNGKDLSGWEVQGGEKNAWKSDGELLSCDGKKGGWLRTS